MGLATPGYVFLLAPTEIGRKLHGKANWIHFDFNETARKILLEELTWFVVHVEWCKCNLCIWRRNFNENESLTKVNFNFECLREGEKSFQETAWREIVIILLIEVEAKSFFSNSVDLLCEDYLEMFPCLLKSPNAFYTNAIIWTLNKHSWQLQMSFADNKKHTASNNEVNGSESMTTSCNLHYI